MARTGQVYSSLGRRTFMNTELRPMDYMGHGRFKRNIFPFSNQDPQAGAFWKIHLDTVMNHRFHVESQFPRLQTHRTVHITVSQILRGMPLPYSYAKTWSWIRMTCIHMSLQEDANILLLGIFVWHVTCTLFIAYKINTLYGCAFPNLGSQFPSSVSFRLTEWLSIAFKQQ